MGLAPMRWLMARMLPRRHRDVKSFDRELEAAGGLAGRFDAGIKTVPAQKIVGSVGRARNLRSDFFYRTGQKMTDRFVRVGQAMQKGIPLPPLELYKVKRQSPDAASPPSEYYVVDGHHRVAMARKLGQDFLDAHVVEYRVKGAPAPPAAAPPAPDGASERSAASPEHEPTAT